MKRRDIIDIALALSHEQLQAVAQSVQCPVHRDHAVVSVDDDGFLLHNACCNRLKPLVQHALFEYKLIVQRKFLLSSLD